MPRVHTIKSARKNYPAEGIEKGDTYYKWSIKTGPASGRVYRSKTYPKPSDLTGSPFQKSLLEIQERISNFEAGNYETAEDLSSDLEQITSDIEALRDETQGSLENMPEGLQQGGVGQTLQDRIDGLEDWLNNLQGVDLNFDFDEEEPEEPEDKESEEHREWTITQQKWEEDKKEAKNEFISNAIDEIQGIEAGI